MWYICPRFDLFLLFATYGRVTCITATSHALWCSLVQPEFESKYEMMFGICHMVSGWWLHPPRVALTHLSASQIESWSGSVPDSFSTFNWHIRICIWVIVKHCVHFLNRITVQSLSWWITVFYQSLRNQCLHKGLVVDDNICWDIYDEYNYFTRNDILLELEKKRNKILKLQAYFVID